VTLRPASSHVESEHARGTSPRSPFSESAVSASEESVRRSSTRPSLAQCPIRPVGALKKPRAASSPPNPSQQ